MVKFSVTVFFLLFSLNSIAQNICEDFEHLFSLPQSYVVYQAFSDITIDGISNETSWEKAVWSDYFQDIEGDKKPIPKYKTRFKMLWDNQFLYILAELEEPHVWAYYTRRDMIIYHENDFEVFIDPDGDTHNYFEFEINAQNTVMDLFMPKPYRNGGKYDIDWDAAGFKSAVFIDGTINDPTDKDKKWTIEMAIPFSALEFNGKYRVPKDGDYWKMNFSRVQWHTEIADGKYQKIKEPATNKFLNEENWVWNKTGVINMHLPESWGLAVFSTHQAGGDKIVFQLPEEEILGKFLWLIFYKQQNYKRLNGEFAASLADLNIDDKLKTAAGESVHLQMEKSEKGFNAFLENKSGLKLSINQDGRFVKIIK